jgi:uncharacterized protein (TIGR02246 family)
MTTTTATPQATEVEAVTAWVAELQRAQWAEDVDGFIALFHPDATWVTAHGKRMTSRDEIAAFTAQVLPGSQAEMRSTYEVVHTVFPRPDLAIVAVRQVAFDLDGEPLDIPEGRPTYVLAHDQGVWRLVAGQNTQVHRG